jgi:D-alanyl-D-alanine carboxypeptidase (penicillin-binding protein 5/6)
MQTMNIAADRVRAQLAFGSCVAVAIATLVVATAPAAAAVPAVERLESLCWDVGAAALLDAATQQPLFLYRSHEIREPASTVKLMLLLLAAEEFESGRKSPDEMVAASRRAQTTGGQQIYLAAGERQSLESLAIATAVHSANDAAVALAEGLFGSYERAVAMMNARARELGLTETRFTSPNGLPPAWGDHADGSTAYDLALLGCEAVAHPYVQGWCSTRRASIPNHNVTMVNANKLLGRVDGVDGLKTGFTRRSERDAGSSARCWARRPVASASSWPASSSSTVSPAASGPSCSRRAARSDDVWPATGWPIRIPREPITSGSPPRARWSSGSTRITWACHRRGKWPFPIRLRRP